MPNSDATILNIRAARHAEAGMVSIHEMTMCFPTDHCTILAFSPAPTPITLEATTWVEDTGAPAPVEVRIVTEDAIWESRLSMGLIG